MTGSGAFGMEQWRPVPGFPGYLVSTHGRVFSERSDKCLRAKAQGAAGHLRVTLRRQGASHHRQVHRLVLLAFVGPCPAGQEALHWDDDPANNHLQNLRWGTRSANRHDAVRNQRARGGRQKGAVISRGQARQVKLLLRDKVPKARIARAVGISATAVRKIERGELWADVLL